MKMMMLSTMVEDDNELAALGKVFAELIDDDADIEY